MMKPLLTRMRHRSFSRYSIIFTITFIVLCFLVWSAIIEIDVVVKSNGRVTTFSNNRVVEHLEGGILTELHVQEGQRIHKDMVLFTVMNPSLTENISILNQRLRGLTAKAQRLYAEMTGKELIAASKQKTRNNEHYLNEQELYKKRARKLSEQISIVRQQINKEEAQLSELDQVIKDMKNERAVAQKQLDILTTLLQEGAGSIHNQLEKKMALLKIETRINQSMKQIPVIAANLSELRLKKKKLMTDFREEAQHNYNKVRLEIVQIQAQIHSSSERQVRKKVAAPVTGTLHTLHVNTIGEVVSPGSILAEIVPDGVPLMVEAMVAPHDRARVWPGQSVNVRVSAYDYTTYGSLRGKVLEVSADTYVDSVTAKHYYKAMIETESSGFDENNQLIPGMTVELNILAGKRTLLGYLLGPLSESIQFTARL
ncbi:MULTISPECIES: HlyD family type I secretion periplasmic adaptor subunit [unclassified Endozoicomonas]|uniref:HlyD family type I secretion periplasmic adaptor subunit n=1 Tax=unclassified Endozoicomonas TaxID=2644528 RepID=UPI002148DA09|nr:MULTISPECIES: HlyD family type I secretion periplasmic adaptor subunit [unclassified Endozoicomonas]